MHRGDCGGLPAGLQNGAAVQYDGAARGLLERGDVRCLGSLGGTCVVVGNGRRGGVRPMAAHFWGAR